MQWKVPVIDWSTGARRHVMIEAPDAEAAKATAKGMGLTPGEVSEAPLDPFASSTPTPGVPPLATGNWLKNQKIWLAAGAAIVLVGVSIWAATTFKVFGTSDTPKTPTDSETATGEKQPGAGESETPAPEVSVEPNS
jgi:hypothetical protein